MLRMMGARFLITAGGNYKYGREKAKRKAAMLG